MKRILVDMSVCLLHHGHIRLLQKAKALGGYVIVALTTDEEVIRHKGYPPELSFAERKEILEALRCVDEVVPCNWKIDEDFLRAHKADFLVHSGDNSNPVSQLQTFDRTQGVSSTDMRRRALESIVIKRNTEKCLLTPGPANLHPSNLYDIRPVFTRGDEQFDQIRQRVLSRILELTGHDTIAACQGSASTAIEIAMASFVRGAVVVVNSGYYSARMENMLGRLRQLLNLDSVRSISYAEFLSNPPAIGSVDWVVATYTETADGFLCDVKELHLAAKKLNAKLFLDATGSINLEKDHDLADVCAFSSCKGLGGLTGAGFICFNQQLLDRKPKAPSFILDIDTYLERKTTQPLHAICSIDSVSERFHELGDRVRLSKQVFMELFAPHIYSTGNQPALCTKVKGIQLAAPDGAVMYQPRIAEPGTQVVCHLFDQFPSNGKPGDFYHRLKAG